MANLNKAVTAPTHGSTTTALRSKASKRDLSNASAPRAEAITHGSSDATALRDGNVGRRVRQLGSARDGLREWQLQRTTALALIPLSLYFVASMLRLATSDQSMAAQWLSAPVPALLTLLFVAALFAHAVVGLRSVLLDYVHTRVRLAAAELLVRGAAILLSAASALAVLKLFLAR
jgi:succinate dehydrogenase / fumarate reductase, membrane anchor subunit